MRTASALIALALLGCTKEGASSASSPIASSDPGPGAKMPAPVPAPAPTPAPAPAPATVAITAVSLAGDCGRPVPEEKRARHSDRDSDRESAKAACEQTSMQLSVLGAPGAAPIQLRVKRVELIDDKGTLIGELTPRAPTVWSKDGTYRPWDQMVAPSQELAVSYALSAPPWHTVAERWNRSYVVRVVVTIGATDRTVQRDVHLAAPASLRPEVET